MQWFVHVLARLANRGDLHQLGGSSRRPNRARQMLFVRQQLVEDRADREAPP
jgi:hypothetical protein